MPKRMPIVLMLCAMSLPAWAQSEAGSAPPPAAVGPDSGPTLDNGEAVPQTVLVSGARPGPGLWKVSKGEHVMWVFGAYSPLPAKMEWHARAVEKIIASSQEYLKMPDTSVEVGWSAMAALPFLVGVKKNPDGRGLKDILSPEVYAQWQPLKQKYFANESGVERERPSFVADELYSRALRHAGLSNGDDVRQRIGQLAARHKLKFTDATYRVEIKDPVKAVREFKKSAMDDAPCLVKTIESLGPEVEAMRARANAWAVGDLDEIRKLSFANRKAACGNALGTSSVAKLQPELKDMPARAAEKWLAAAEKALATNASTFTVVRMEDILDPTGVIATLQARGYTVEPPK